MKSFGNDKKNFRKCYIDFCNAKLPGLVHFFPFTFRINEFIYLNDFIIDSINYF